MCTHTHTTAGSWSVQTIAQTFTETKYRSQNSSSAMGWTKMFSLFKRKTNQQITKADVVLINALSITGSTFLPASDFLSTGRIPAKRRILPIQLNCKCVQAAANSHQLSHYFQCSYHCVYQFSSFNKIEGLQLSIFTSVWSLKWLECNQVLPTTNTLFNLWEEEEEK